MISSTGSAITARDFNDNTNDSHRDEWNSGAMHHLVKALKGAPVAVVLDKRTGFVEFNVTLGGVRQTPGYGTYQVLVERTYSDGTTGGCWYPLLKVGAVIVLGESRARWEALESYREERIRAVTKLGEKLARQLGVNSRYDLPHGKFDARLFPGLVHVSFQPESYRGELSYTWEQYTSAELAGV